MENAGFYVYLWSIYGNITITIGILLFLSWSCVALMLIFVLEEEYTKNLPIKKALTFSVVVTLIHVALPKKEYLPYIVSATPISKAIIESATSKDGKLNKVDKLIDISLDKAIEAVQNNVKDK